MTGTRKTLSLALWLALLAPLSLAISGCDSAPGAEDPFARPPVVRDVVFTPRLIQIDDLPQSARVGDNVLVPITVSATASDADGDLDRVAFVIQSPVGATEPIASGEMTLSAGRYSATQDVLFPVALTGSYVLIVYASDQRGALGNELRGVIELAATGSPPVIESIEAPGTVVRPAAGEPPVPIQLIAVVSDPDGLANVARVEVRFNGGSPLVLCDDGGQSGCNPGFASGDLTAGDARFTLTVQVDSDTSASTSTLEFIATDRSGLSSEPVTRTLIIE
ncbi:MAG: hypothetical protein ACI80V_001330 [Rhodothermales bacterium]|jgi:hypothetical protein